MLISVMQIKNEYACEHYIIIGTITNLYFFGRNLLVKLFEKITLAINEFAPALILGLLIIVFHADSKSVFSFSPACLNLEIMYLCFLH